VRETTWLQADEGEIEEVANKLTQNEGWKTAEVRWTRVRSTRLRVHSKSRAYLDYLVENYHSPVHDGDLDERLVTLYYYAGDKKGLVDELRPGRADFVETPCLGLYAKESQLGLIAGLDEYGLMKSTALGLHSRVLFDDGWYPVHGAVFQIAGKGVILIGHHGAGKSTALLGLMHRARDKKVCASLLTDDWAVARMHGTGKVEIRAIDDRISFSERLAKENPELGILELIPKKRPAGIDKFWIPINDVFPGTARKRLLLDAVVVLVPLAADHLIRQANSEEVCEILSDSAYHMPDCGGVADKLRIFWRLVLASRPCLLVDSRYSKGRRDENYHLILDAIAGL